MINCSINNSIQIIKDELLNMPNKPGVYRMLNKESKVLYVGKAKDLAKRIINYTQIDRLCERMKLAISETSKLEIITVNTEAQALVLEANLIRSLKPKYNILLKDDKSMPYILLRQEHDFPQLIKFRGKKSIKGKYFGPFASPKIVDDTIEFIEKSFLLRNCSDSFFTNRKSPCMQYQIKRCSAPCVGKITFEEYQNNTKQALSFLQGKSTILQQELSHNMQQASDNMEYEKAARYRDQLRSLNYIQNKNTNLFNIENADVIAIAKEGDMACVQLFLFRNGQNYGNRCFFFEKADEDESNIITLFLMQLYQNSELPKETIINVVPRDLIDLEEAFKLKIVIPKTGDKLKAIDFAINNALTALHRKNTERSQIQNLQNQIRDLFQIKHPIKRIEVYDNSHIMGSHAIGAMIVATPEGFSKKHYRKYDIKTTDIGNDYAMLEEVLTRRFLKLDEANYPDLLLIDGGAGHLSIAKKVIEKFQLNITFICISKGVDRNAGKEIFHQVDKESFTLDKSIPVMKYLQNLRDEAHRFAITGHRKKRSKAINFSILNQIPGIGNKRRKLLINHFTSISEIQNADISQLTKLEGISKKIAQEIYNFFHQ